MTYNEYVTELTFLLFLKMMEETGRERTCSRTGYRWSELVKRDGTRAARLLQAPASRPRHQGEGRTSSAPSSPTRKTTLRKPTNLKALTDAIDKLDWFSAREEGLGNLYEGLLEKNAAEKKSARAVFHAAPAHRLHRAADEAAGGRDHAGPGGGHRRVSRRRGPLHQGRRPTISSSCREAQVVSFRGTTPMSGWSWCRTRIAFA